MAGFTLQDCKQHTTVKSCWIIIQGKVYDVTAFLEEHPGGFDVIISSTGGRMPAVMHAPFTGLWRPISMLVCFVQAKTPRRTLSRSATVPRLSSCLISTTWATLRYSVPAQNRVFAMHARTCTYMQEAGVRALMGDAPPCSMQPPPPCKP